MLRIEAPTMYRRELRRCSGPAHCGEADAAPLAPVGIRRPRRGMACDADAVVRLAQVDQLAQSTHAWKVAVWAAVA